MDAGSAKSDQKWERRARLSGAVGGVLWLASLLVLEGGGNPAAPETAAELVAHFRDNRTAILVAGLIHGLGGLAFLLFVATLRSAFEHAAVATNRWLIHAIVVGGTTAGAMMLCILGPQTSGATTDTKLLDAGSAVTFWRLAHSFFVAAEIAFALFFVAVGVLSLRHAVLPRWLGWASIVIAVLLLIVPIGWIALLFLVPIWLVVASGLLFARARSSAVTA